jgi:acetyl esterase/lipase
LDDRTGFCADPNPFSGEYGWTRSNNAFGWECLLGHELGRQDVSPYASPARETELDGLPPTFIWVGALDLFVDESIEYARRLIRAGVATELHVCPGVTHANILVPDAPSSHLCRSDVLRVLRKGL